jgi:hypothetical protein
MKSRAACCLVVCLVSPPNIANAQTSLGDSRAFAALRSSHVGSLTPLLTPAMISRQLNGAQLAIRYGRRDERNVRTQAIAASAVFGIGLQSSATFTAGALDADCTSCSPALLLGIGGDMRVAEFGDIMGGGSQLSVAVSGDLGYAQLKPGDDYAATLAVGAPITLSLSGGGREALRIAPYFTPVFGVGETSTPCMNTASTCDKSGMRWVLGGGVGVWNRTSSVSASLGVNQVVLSGARPVFGLNVIFGGR